MRKYYKPCNIRKRDITARLSAKVEPWSLLSAFMQGARSLLSPELQALADRCITTRSVTDYLELSSFVNNRTQSYSVIDDAATVWCERQLGSLLKKYPFSSSECDLTVSPRHAATAKWLECEASCKSTNDRLTGHPEDPSWLARCCELVSSILGELSPERVMKIIAQGSHGPGSTLTSCGNRTSSYYKYYDLPYSCTKRALPYAYAVISSNARWMNILRERIPLPTIPVEGASPLQVQLMYLTRAMEIRDSDKITFTSKDCTTDRPITVGASMNIFLQLGVKAELEECLKRFGIDLTDQTKNQRFAELGSRFCLRDGLISDTQFSTVDLASASDTISYELVKKLLPADWFAFLLDLRHDTGTLPDGSVHSYQKFSAMGNGFTFPLESLIFFCISKAASEDAGYPSTPNDITVFGDDIIIRYRCAQPVISALRWAGFEVNSSKSFLQGPFKESCGKDYFNGHLVRPFYLKRRINTIEDVYFVANSIMRLFSSSNLSAPWAYSLYEYLVSLIPVTVRSYGPMDYDSSYLSVPFSFIKSRSTRPYLSSAERAALNQAHMLGECYQHSPIVIRTLTVPRKYRARQDVLYLIKLSESCRISPRYEWVSGKLRISSESATYATRREAYSRLVVASSVPKWDAEVPSHNVRASLLLNIVN